MFTLDVSNVHEALARGYAMLGTYGEEQASRAGDVYVMPEPTTTVYRKPDQRVLFWPSRNANPFFHFMESLWMLNGRRDVAWITQFNKSFAQFSDDGEIYHGAYGYRWRHHWGYDQLNQCITLLKENPLDRRVVLQMWDPDVDLGQQGRDFPCNQSVYFRVKSDNTLDMTVMCRSNDMIWGAYGANAVHFSMLQEYVARCIGCEVGSYWQIANNFHGYKDTMDKHWSDDLNTIVDPYADDVEPFPIMSTDKYTWDNELGMFIEDGPVIGYTEPFFKSVACPMYITWFNWKEKGKAAALETVDDIAATDWRKACREWLERK